MTEDFVFLFNESIRKGLANALRISVRSPALARFVMRAVKHQRKAVRTRKAWAEQGVHVPPFMIASITNRCNLQCAGCYARAQGRSQETEMSAAKLRDVVAQAHELGVSIIMLAGGEPLVRPEILDITRDFPKIIFPMFTNGLLIDETTVKRLKKQKNVVPVISLEGRAQDTDRRRGKGVHERLIEVIEVLGAEGVFLGISLTLTRENFDVATDEDYIRQMVKLGCRLFFFVEYVPVQEGTEHLILTEEQNGEILSMIDKFRAELPGLFIAFPGNEEEFGGCLAAGRGFVHVSPEGRVEPCPFAPFSDASLADASLKEALQSEFLKAIRESEQHLKETGGGWGLWTNREWVASILQSKTS